MRNVKEFHPDQVVLYIGTREAYQDMVMLIKEANPCPRLLKDGHRDCIRVAFFPETVCTGQLLTFDLPEIEPTYPRGFPPECSGSYKLFIEPEKL